MGCYRNRKSNVEVVNKCSPAPRGGVLTAKKPIPPGFDLYFQMAKQRKTRRKRRGIRPAEIKTMPEGVWFNKFTAFSPPRAISTKRSPFPNNSTVRIEEFRSISVVNRFGPISQRLAAGKTPKFPWLILRCLRRGRTFGDIHIPFYIRRPGQFK